MVKGLHVVCRVVGSFFKRSIQQSPFSGKHIVQLPKILTPFSMPDSRMSSASRARDLVGSLERLPSPPAVAGKILELALDDSANLERISKLVASDGALTIKVLKHANAVAHNLIGRVDNVDQAISLLGLEELRGLVLGVIVRETLVRKKSGDDPYANAIWRHSLACGLAASLVAERALPRIAGLAYAAGLIHDCGKLAFLSLFPDEYEALLDAPCTSLDQLRVREKECFGADHTQMGKWLAERWGLPAALVEACWLHHHDPEALESMAAGRGIPALLVALADNLAHETLLDSARHNLSRERGHLLQVLDLKPLVLKGLQDELGKRFAAQAKYFLLEEGEVGFYMLAAENARQRLAESSAMQDRATSRLTRANSVLRRLAQAGRMLALVTSSRNALEATARVLAELPGTQGGCVYRIHNGGQQLQGFTAYPGGQTSPLRGRMVDKRLRLEGDKLPAQADALADFPRRRADCAVGHPGTIRAGDYLAVPLVADGIWFGELLYRVAGNGPDEVDGYQQLAGMAAAALRRLELGERLEERAESLADALQRLKATHAKMLQNERLAAVGQLAAGAAHEINNPLAIISARTQLLEIKEEDERKREVLQLIISQIERISTILTDLMDFARPAPPHFGDVDLRQVLEKTLALSKSGLESQGVTVLADIDAGLPKVRGDKAQLEQVFLNLAINAQHALEALESEDHRRELALSASHDAARGQVVVRLADTGVGISQDNLAKVFDPFFTTKPEGKGTGLGLSTTYGIITSHEGEISFASEPGKGTTVTVRLPVAASASPSGAPGHKNRTDRNQTEGAGLGDNAVLVVDDEAHIRDILREALESEGFVVQTARNGEEALNKLQQQTYRLMMLDIRMPGRGGLSLLTEIRDLTRSMPVIVLTGLASHEEIETAMSLGARRFVRKPFQIDALLAEVREVLAAGRAER